MTTKNTETQPVFYQERKGQSAIEYLMTYGWMLLVVAIVGGAIFATVSGQCLNDVTGFTGETAEVSDYAVTDEVIQVEVQNNGADSLDEVGVALYDDLDEDPLLAGTEDGVSVGSDTTFELADNQVDIEDGSQADATDSETPEDGISQVEACNDYELEIYYTSDSFDDIVQVASGSIQGNFEPVDTGE